MHNVTDMATNVSVFMSNPDNKTLWQTNKAITDTMAEVDGDLATLAGLDTKQLAPITGQAAEKATTRFAFESQILVIASQLAALAAKNNDTVLEAQSDLSLSALDKMAVQDLEETGTRIANLATANLTALADYNITAADVTAVGTLQAKFHAAQTAPRQAIVDRKKENDMLPPLVSDLLSTLRRQLDRQMIAFKQGNPEFYAGYVAARVIVDRGNPAKAKKPAPAPAPTA
jgi:hypothetical protein